MKTIYTFFGLPASGKGTQAKILAKEKNISRIVGVGDLIRDIIKGELQDPFTLEVKQRYDTGVPQPDSVAVDLVSRYLNEAKTDVILDNFPFGAGQAEFLEHYISNHPEWSKLVVIYIKVDAETAVKRSISRKICTGCGAIYGITKEIICEKCGGSLVVRADDNEETMRNRIEHYLPKVKELIEYYSNKNAIVIEVDGEKPVKEVSAEIKSKL
jgi:adenylate kinase